MSASRVGRQARRIVSSTHALTAGPPADRISDLVSKAASTSIFSSAVEPGLTRFVTVPANRKALAQRGVGFEVRDLDKSVEAESAETSGRTPISLGHRRANELFETTHRKWRKAFKPKKLRILVRKVAADRFDVGTKHLEDLKHLRRRVSKLRAMFIVLSQGNESPKELHEFVRVFGVMKDAIEAKAPDEAAKAARRFLKLLTPEKLDALDKSIRSFRPISRDSFDKFLKGQFEALSPFLSSDELLAKRFHQIRQELRNLMDLLDLLADSDPALEGSLNRLRELSDELGLDHDRVVQAGMRGELEYERATIRLPRTLGRTLSEMRDLFLEGQLPPAEPEPVPSAPNDWL